MPEPIDGAAWFINWRAARPAPYRAGVKTQSATKSPEGRRWGCLAACLLLAASEAAFVRHGLAAWHDVLQSRAPAQLATASGAPPLLWNAQPLQ